MADACLMLCAAGGAVGQCRIAQPRHTGCFPVPLDANVDALRAGQVVATGAGQVHPKRQRRVHKRGNFVRGDPLGTKRVRGDRPPPAFCRVAFSRQRDKGGIRRRRRAPNAPTVHGENDLATTCGDDRLCVPGNGAVFAICADDLGGGDDDRLLGHGVGVAEHLEHPAEVWVVPAARPRCGREGHDVRVSPRRAELWGAQLGHRVAEAFAAEPGGFAARLPLRAVAVVVDAAVLRDELFTAVFLRAHLAALADKEALLLARAQVRILIRVGRELEGTRLLRAAAALVEGWARLGRAVVVGGAAVAHTRVVCRAAGRAHGEGCAKPSNCGQIPVKLDADVKQVDLRRCLLVQVYFKGPHVVHEHYLLGKLCGLQRHGPVRLCGGGGQGARVGVAAFNRFASATHGHGQHVGPANLDRDGGVVGGRRAVRERLRRLDLE